MSSLLEKAADAVSDVERERGDAFDVGPVMARNIVRAVLLAVRKPDDATITRACAREHHCEDLRTHFTATIDAILGDEVRQ